MTISTKAVLFVHKTKVINISMKKEFIELMRSAVGKHVEGKASGFSKWLNGRIRSVQENGDLEMEFDVRPDMCNPFGVLHGGAASAIADEIMGLLLFVKSEETATYLSMSIHVQFIKTAKMGDTVIAVPEIVRIGKQTAVVHCALKSMDGVVVAHASSNFLRMS